MDRHWRVLIDLMLNRCRTAVNVFSSPCVAVVTTRSEGETGVLSG